MSRTILSFNSLTNYQIYFASFAIYPSKIYSALVVAVKTVLFFLLFYNTTALFRKKQYPMTNF